MKLHHRRHFLHLAAGAAALPTFSWTASALDYPTRPVHWVVSSAPGGSGDIVSRLIGRSLSDRFGQPFVFENRPGAGVNIATEAVVRAPADGYTLLILNKASVASETLYSNLNFSFSHDIEPVAGIASGPLLMLVNPSVPVSSVPEFIAYARANPAKINMGSAGNGTDPHLAGALFMMLTGINMAHVPYRGGALALNDLLGGQVQVMFSNLPVRDFIKSGKLRALAVTTKTRSADFPDIPAVSEFVPDYDADVWFGVGVRKNTPSEIVEKLNREINAALSETQTIAGLANLGSFPLTLTPVEFARFIAVETEKWSKVIKFAGIKLD
jgi:tripartite-type tricarboxylate transporter receptor subunit TctC